MSHQIENNKNNNPLIKLDKVCGNIICPHNETDISVLMKTAPGICRKFTDPINKCYIHTSVIPTEIYLPKQKIINLIRMFNPKLATPEEAYRLIEEIRKLINDFDDNDYTGDITGKIGCFPVLLIIGISFTFMSFIIRVTL